MSMMEVLTQMRDKEREKDGNEIQWICLIRQDQCTKPNISCHDCPVYNITARKPMVFRPWDEWR